ncbi:LysM peptidoglycan-binding domain-containing protein [Exiguobacterium profundum]|uniref:LysM peptidoglycan-binding domain-containing protein n=1 Tax=Exiguobacterium profundum TaxID=307643 RepID=UPI0029C2DEF6|nr:LysM peptidoglycan-binding domain-containing protein [Exiguobacterium profundum]MDX5982267.1 LysM peptidoglycan-binding domain-containing protein [Exiguobacterium profundum]
MAKLGTYQIKVIEESSSFSVNATEHEVEKGVKLTDHVKANNATFSITGKAVGSSQHVARLEKYFMESMEKGRVLTYVGRSRFTNVIILSFNKRQNSKIANGFAFDMQLREVRIARSSVKRNSQTAKKQNGGTVQKTQSKQSTKRYYTVKKGDTLWAIAKKYYGKPDYARIYNANRNSIKNVNLIYPGQRFLIP